MTGTSDCGPNRIDRRKFLKASGGTVAGIGAISIGSGTVAAHFPAELDIDIKPGCDKNPVNPSSRGVIPVAVHQTEDFDPTTEGVRYRFGAPDTVEDGGGARPSHDGHREDVNGDGTTDLVLHFPVEETGFDSEDSEGKLLWERDEAGEHGLSGSDEVTIVGP
ncbi:twin-arginine translocation signal domain-containing protein [Natronorubrum halophilum]|uniref:twin-arginine translocation signal domain-containing protein n=1 Tax=Natronorubrum halophilum TaxID=1702106 RepID=UPI0010C18E60|nr:twin-arginine translocation signal domain-containing protein [Natronorubrum halophilum]